MSDQFASSVKMKGGRYEVSLSWREYHDPLPTMTSKKAYGTPTSIEAEPRDSQGI